MAEGEHPDKDPHRDDDDKMDFKKVQDKYEELKSHPKVKATKGLFANYFVEIIYLAAAIIAFIISLIRPGNGGLIFVGIGFIVGLFLFSILRVTTHRVGTFLTKQELVVHIIIAIILLILACIIPTIMMGVLVGVPAGFGVRTWIFGVKGELGGDDDDHKHGDHKHGDHKRDDHKRDDHHPHK